MLLYIDPGTGSMLFTILLGVISAGYYAVKKYLIKLRFLISGGKQGTPNGDGIIPYVIFSDDKRYWNVFKPICDVFEERKISVVYMTASDDDAALYEDYKYVKAEFIGKGNQAFSKLNNLKADVLLSTTPSLDVYQWKRSDDVKYYIHIPHAASDITLYRMFGIDYYDAILLSGSYQCEQIRELERIRNLPEKELAIVGIPFMDVMRKKVQLNKQQKNEIPHILMAPSWGPSSLLNKYGEKIIDALIDTGYNLTIRPHPQSYSSEKELIERLIKKYPDGEVVSWNSDRDNFDILNSSDILISDFSGVIFDYALIFDKPIIYTDTEFDKSIYDACWIDEDLWTFRILPEIGSQLSPKDVSNTNIKKLIDKCLSSEEYQAGRDKARRETWENMGNGAVAVANYLIDKRAELLQDKREN